MTPPTERRPERWRADAGERDVATLDIPPSLQHERRFTIDVRFEARAPEALGAAAALALTVELDGRQQWARRITPHAAGQTDSLDYHCRLALPPGRALRVRALARCSGGVRRLQLRIEADEELPA